MNKFVAIFLTCSFLVLNSLYPSPFLLASPVPSETSPPLLPLAALGVPEEFGSVIETYTGKDPRTAILIQDAHAVPDAQKSIQKIVEYFLEKHGVRLVTLEGASGRLDPFLLRTFPDRQLLQKVISTYLDKGELSGAAASSFLSRPEADYYGIEDQALYEKGIDAFLRSLKMQPALLARLESELRNLEVLKEGAYSPALLEFDRILNAFHENSGHFSKLLRYLEIRARNNSRLGQRYPHLVSFFARKKRLAARPSSRRLRQDDVSEALLTKMKAPSFFDEFDAFAKEIKEGLIQSSRESTLDQKDQRSRLLLKMARFQLTREDWREIRSIRVPSDFQDFIRFYQISAARDGALAKNLLRLLEEKKTNSSIVVAGGFHTTGFQEVFKHSGISYVLIAPQINRVPQETPYLDLMQGRVSWSHRFEMRNGWVDLYEAFHRETVDRLLATAKGGNTVKTWRERLLLELFQKRRMDESKNYTRFIDEAAAKLIDPAKLEVLRKQWFEKVDRLAKEWSLSATTIPRVTLPFGRFPAGWLTALPSSSPPRSEVRDATTKDSRKKSWAEEKASRTVDYTFVSRQLEAGLDRWLRQELTKAYGEGITDLVSQTTLAGGLGALMPDLFDGWAANGIDVLAITPIYERIKGQKYTDREVLDDLLGKNSHELGHYLRDLLKKMSGGKPTVQFEFRLKVAQAFKERTGWSKARELLDPAMDVRNLTRQIVAEFYETKTPRGASRFHMTLYFKNDQGQEVRIFDEQYPDDPAWKEIHMAAYGFASEMLLTILRENKRIKDKIFFVDNEAYASLPTPRYARSPRKSINHTVVAAGLPRPHESSFTTLRFPEVERKFLHRHDSFKNERYIDIPHFAATHYNFVTGVSLEHNGILRKYPFLYKLSPQKVKEFNRDGLRNTNGVLLDEWQSPLIRALIERYKGILIAKLKLTGEVDDQTFFNRLRGNGNGATLQRFIQRFEYIKALHAMELLIWMAEGQIHKKYNNSAWLNDVIEKYQENFHQEFEKYDPDVRGTFEQFKILLRTAIGDENKPWSESTWKKLEKEETEPYKRLRILKDILIRDPIISNVRRQVPYKGPEKWLELLRNLREGVLQDLPLLFAHEIASYSGGSQAIKKHGDLGGLTKRLLEEPDTAKQELTRLLSSVSLNEAQYANVLKRWAEDLPSRIANTETLKKFRTKKPRILFGGRLFEDASYRNYLEIKKLVDLLGIQDRVATMDNYNLNNAARIYWAVADTTTVFEEDKEASSTSGMKGIVNGAGMTASWGAAPRELLEILDVKAKTRVDVVERHVSHDAAVLLLRLGIYSLENGHLVEYPSEEEEGSRSHEKRQPLEMSLDEALEALGQVFKDPLRRLRFESASLATSPMVDIIRGQARAHAFMWQEAIEEQEKEETLLSKLRMSPEDISTLFAKKEFIWRPKGPGGELDERTSFPSRGGGFLGLVEGYRWIRTSGEEGYSSIKSHATRRTGEGMGDILSHLLTEIFPLETNEFVSVSDRERTLWGPVRDELETLGNEAKQKRRSATAKVQLSLEALDLMEKVAVHVSGEILRNYLLFKDDKNAKEFTVLENLLRDIRVRENLVRYLDRNATPLESSAERIRAYAVPFKGKQAIVLVDIGAGRGAEGKAWTHLDWREAVSGVFGKEVPDQRPSPIILKRDAVTGQDFPAERGHYELVAFGVEDTGLQIVTLDIMEESQLLNYIKEAVKGAGVKINGAIQKEINGLPKTSEERRKILSQIAEMTREDIVARVGEQGVSPLMVLVTTLSPSLLTSTPMKTWDQETYEILSRVIQDRSVHDLFENGDIHAHVTDENGATAFSRVLGNRQIIVAIQFDSTASPGWEGKKWFSILDIHELGTVDSDEMKYQFHDLVTGETYAPVSGATLHREKLKVGVRQFQILEKIRPSGRAEVRDIPNTEYEILTALAEGRENAALRGAEELLRGSDIGEKSNGLRRMRLEADSDFYLFLLSRNEPVIRPQPGVQESNRVNAPTFLDSGNPTEVAYLSTMA